MNTVAPVFEDAEKGSSLWHDAWLRLRKNKLALLGGSVLLFMVVVALLTVEGSDIIAASPMVFRSEQYRGLWIEHDNPLIVLHFPSSNLVVEVQYRLQRPGEWRAGFAAPIWLRFGHIDDGAAFLASIAIWPLWRSGRTRSRLARRRA